MGKKQFPKKEILVALENMKKMLILTQKRNAKENIMRYHWQRSFSLVTLYIGKAMGKHALSCLLAA